MAASTEQKVDYLLKKIGFTASKTGLAEDSSLSGTKKAPFAESIPSPLVTPSTTIWNESALIPTTPPGSDTAQVRVYLAGTSGHRMTVDSTVSGSRAFIAYSTYNNTSSGILGDWIDPQFGDAYIIKVYKGDPNSGGTLLSAAGSGSNDTWFFDYSSGVLNFNGTAIPSGVTDTNIYIVGYRYIGVKGLSTAGINTSATSTFKDLTVTGVSTFTGNINANGNIVGDNATNITGINNISASGISSASAFADFDYLQAPFGSTTTFTVTVASKDSTHRYQGQGSGNAYLINGVQSPILNLTPGRTYRFNNTNTGSHPLKFYYDANRTTLYTTGVNFQNTYTEITISDTTPNVLHYQCTNHGLMGNAIINNSNVVDSPYDATLRSGLNVTGLSTFAGNINANGNIVGDNSTNITGIAGVTATTLSGTLQTAAQPNVTSLGTLTSLNVTGDVSIGGTLTYEDVTNIDSVGLITARTGIKVLAGGINAVGVVTATSFDGSLATTNLTGTITNAQLAGSIANDKLANSTVSYGGVSLALGETDATPAFNLTDATNYPFTSLTGITTTILGDATPKLGGDLNGNGKSIFNVGISSASAFADFDYLQAPFGSTTTFTVTVASKDATHRYNGQGSGNAYLINGVQAPVLSLTPGRTYRFTNDNTGSHPLKFYYQADRTTLYTTGVNFQNTYTEITISDTTPDVLHYQCTNHGLMGNSIITNSNVVDTPYTATFREGQTVSGVSTFTGNINANGNIVGDSATNITGIAGVTASTLTGTLQTAAQTNITSLGTLGSLTVSGNINANGNIVGDNATNISGINSVTATTYFGDGTKLIGVSTAGISTVGTATLNNLEVTGVSTFTNSIQIKSDDNTPARIDLYCESNNAHYLRLQAPPHSSFSGNPTVILPNVAGDIIVGDTSSAIDQDINTTGDITAANLTGTLQTAAQPNITSVGTLTSLNVTGDVSIGGTLTYEDVTNIDSLGIVTARTGIKVLAGGINAVGVVTGTNGLSGTILTAAQTNITSVGTLSALTVSGNINANGNIVGDDATNISGINSVTATKFFGNGEGLTNVGVDTATVNTNSVDTITLNVTGVSTFAGLVDINGNLQTSGNVTLGNGTGDNIDVQGRFVRELVPSSNGDKDLGTSSFRWGTLHVKNILQGGGGTVDVGFSTFREGIFVTGISTFSANSNAINANSNTSNAAINIQLSGNTKGSLIPKSDGLEINSTGDDDVVAHVNSAGGNSGDFIVKSSGSELFKIDSGTIESTFTSTDTGSSAGPVVNLYRNSASPADADYLGQIKFQGESDTGVQRNYAKITGKILDASNGTEDGIIEFAHIKAGSQNISARFRSDSLQLLNDTNLSVAGDTTLTGDLDVDGHTELDNLRVSGVSTFSDHITIPSTKEIKFNNANNTISRNSITPDGGSSRQSLLIRTAGSEDIILQTNGSGGGSGGTLRVMSGTEHQLVANENDSVDLYFNGSKKFETTNTGAVVTGILTATSFSGDGSSLTNVGFTTSVGTFNASSGVANIDSFAHATEDYKVAEYTLHFTNGSNIQAQKLLVMQDGSTAYSQEFAVMSSASQLVTVDATISGANVLVRATPETGVSGTTTFRWRRIVQE